MKTFIALINREFWEQRGVFFSLPMVIGILMVAAAIFGFLLSLGGHAHISFIDAHIPGHHVSETSITTLFFISSIPFMIVLWLTVFYYYIGTLYDDRKDNSILFWRSLPISETQTISSKLIAGNVLAPFCTWVCMMVVQLLLLVIASVFLMVHPVMPWIDLWRPFTMISTWLHIFELMIVQGLWLLPLFAWCMLCSSFSKKAPALRAIVPVVLLMMCDLFFVQHHYFIHFIATRFEGAAQTFGNIISHHHTALAMQPLWLPNDISMALGLGVAAVLIVIAGNLRRQAS
jgi:ABC-2 type transport system permease protein